MSSEKNKNLLYDYVNGLLSDNDKAEFENRLSRSDALQNELKRVQQYYSLVKSSEQSDVPRDFVDNVHRKIGDYSYNELTDNKTTQVLATASARRESRSFEDSPVSVDTLKGNKSISRFRSHFKRWFSFEVAGVLATVAILVFVFIPNVNIPERTKKLQYDESMLPAAVEKGIPAEQLQGNGKSIPESEITKPVVKSENRIETDNKVLSEKNAGEKKSIPEKAAAQSPVKELIAKERVSQGAPISPVPSAAPSVSKSTAIDIDLSESGSSGEYSKEVSSQELPVPATVLSSHSTDKAQTESSVRIIMTTATKTAFNNTPLSAQAETKMTKDSRSERRKKRDSKNTMEESANFSTKSAYSEIAVLEKNELEAMFSEHGVAWKFVHQDTGRLVYSLNGSTKTINSLINKLILRGFVARGNQELIYDSVNVELEINF